MFIHALMHNSEPLGKTSHLAATVLPPAPGTPTSFVSACLTHCLQRHPALESGCQAPPTNRKWLSGEMDE